MWDEMFGVKEEAVEEVKVKKPRKKIVIKKIARKCLRKTPYVRRLQLESRSQPRPKS